MRLMQSLIRRLQSMVSKESSNVALHEELRFHLERLVEENMAQGMTEREAVAAAQASFGNWAGTTQQCYQARGTAWIDDLFQDVRYGLRTLKKQRSFAVTSVLTLAIGIGACTAIFSVVNAVLLRSLPYGNPEQLVNLYTPSLRLLRQGIPAELFNPSFADFSDLKKQSHLLEAVTLFEQTTFNVAADSQVERVGAARVDAEFFRTLQSQPELGRAIDAGDQQPGSNQVTIISHGLWLEMFDGTKNILGRAIRFDGATYRIIGVMPAGFAYPHMGDLPVGFGSVDHTQIWLPAALSPRQMACRDCGGFVLARLQRGVTLREAETELSAIMARLNSLHDPAMHDFVGRLEPLLDISAGPVRPLMRLLLVSVGLLWLIACANAASLLMARAASRTHELGVRATLGAKRERLFRQMITESLLLSLAAGCAGTAFAWFFIRGLLRLNPGDIPRIEGAALDLRMLGFLAGITVLTSLVFGVLPASIASRVNLAALLKSGGMRGVTDDKARIRRVLSIAQVALVVVLLTATGLLLRSYAKVLEVPVGFSPSTITANIQFSPPLAGWPANPRYDTPEKRKAFFAEAIERLQHTPGIQAAGWIDFLPLSNAEDMNNIEVQGSSNKKDGLVESRRVSPGYFAAMQIPLIRGKAFSDAAGPKDPEQVIVNETLATEYFGGADPVGRHIRVSPKDPWLSIIGVIADVRIENPESNAAPQIYTSLWQTDTSAWPTNLAFLAVRSILPETAEILDIRNAIQRLDPDLALADIHTMRALKSEKTARRQFQTMLLTAFSAIAMVLAVIGVYGLLAFWVRQRTIEIGIRVALGSTKKGVIGIVLREGMILTGTGLGIGIAVSMALTRLVSGFLYGVPGIDPYTYLMVACLLLFGTMTACVVPGLRATRIDPIKALRSE